MTPVNLDDLDPGVLLVLGAIAWSAYAVMVWRERRMSVEADIVLDHEGNTHHMLAPRGRGRGRGRVGDRGNAPRDRARSSRRGVLRALIARRAVSVHRATLIDSEAAR